MRHSGPNANTWGSLSEDALAALRCGDVPALIAVNKARWGGLVMMADSADDEPDDDDKDKDEPGKDDKADDEPTGGGDDVDKIDKAEFDRLMARMKAADKRASEAEAALKKQEDAKKDDLTKATDRVTELETTVEELSGTVRSLRLENAFLSANKHKWHDPEIALDLAQRKGFIEDDIIGDDGKVDKPSLTKALDRLAKEHAYLVAKDKKEKDTPDTPSGDPAGGRSDNSKDDKAKRQKLEGRFPVLQRNR